MSIEQKIDCFTENTLRFRHRNYQSSTPTVSHCSHSVRSVTAHHDPDESFGVCHRWLSRDSGWDRLCSQSCLAGVHATDSKSSETVDFLSCLAFAEFTVGSVLVLVSLDDDRCRKGCLSPTTGYQRRAEHSLVGTLESVESLRERSSITQSIFLVSRSAADSDRHVLHAKTRSLSDEQCSECDWHDAVLLARSFAWLSPTQSRSQLFPAVRSALSSIEHARGHLGIASSIHLHEIEREMEGDHRSTDDSTGERTESIDARRRSSNPRSMRRRSDRRTSELRERRHSVQRRHFRSPVI